MSKSKRRRAWESRRVLPVILEVSGERVDVLMSGAMYERLCAHFPGGSGIITIKPKEYQSAAQ